MNRKWNSGMDYSFSAVKTIMRIFGVWPFQDHELLSTIRWLILVVTETLSLISILVGAFQHCGYTIDVLEILIIIEGCIHGWISSVFLRLYMKKMIININSAIDDWATLSMKKEHRMIMTNYARVGRIIVLGNILVALMSVVVYIVTVVFDENQQVIIVDNNTMIIWNFLWPQTCLFNGVSYNTYSVLIVIQILQVALIGLAESVSDSFFFCITMHLCGQLEILNNRFTEVIEKFGGKDHYRSLLRPLIMRHYQLITLAKNIEDSFNINILMRFLIISVVIAASGIRLISLARYHDYIEIFKMVLYIQFYIVHCFLFTHASVTLHDQSESIISAIYSTTWYELPPTTIKDLMLVMMRLKVPLQLSVGKFFYLSRTTMTDMLKGTMTYISFLQVTMQK